MRGKEVQENSCIAARDIAEKKLDKKFFLPLLSRCLSSPNQPTTPPLSFPPESEKILHVEKKKPSERRRRRRRRKKKESYLPEKEERGGKKILF